MLKANGLKSRVKLQRHAWSKDVKLDGESFESNTTTGMIADSNIFFECNAQVKNKKFLGTTLNVQPLYSIIWQNDWPCIINQHLLRIRKFDQQIAINKKIKLKINQSLKKFGKSSSYCSEPNTPPLAPDITKNNYNTAALNIDLNGICPSIYS